MLTQVKKKNYLLVKILKTGTTSQEAIRVSPSAYAARHLRSRAAVAAN